MPRPTSTAGSSSASVTVSTGAELPGSEVARPPRSRRRRPWRRPPPATAQRGANRVSTSQTTIAGSARYRHAAPRRAPAPGRSGTGCRPAWRSRSAFGMRVIARASHGQRPVISSSTPHSRKAPTAARVVAGRRLRRDQQGRAGRRPGERERQPVPQAEHDREGALEDAQREQTGCGVRRARPDRLQPGDHAARTNSRIR